MQPLVAGTLRREFSGRSEAAAFRHFQQQQQEQRNRRDRDDDVDKDASDFLDMTALIVSEVEIREFRLQLDRYDAATIEALYDNQAALDLILQRKEELLGRAYVISDGRRVFKSQDGIRVFDEHGMELDASEIDPDLIDETHPIWEVYKPILEESIRLEEERRALLQYQAKLDHARECLDKGDITREEFDRLRDDLVADMPDAVREQIPELANQGPQAGQEATAQTATQETTLVIDDDMVPSSVAPPGMAPGFAG